MPSFLDDISSFYGTGEKNEKGQTLEEFLKEYDPYQYKNPCATTDMVLFFYAGEKPDTDALKVLLVCRKNHPKSCGKYPNNRRYSVPISDIRILSQVMLPFVGCKIPQINRINVVFPAPFSPNKP